MYFVFREMQNTKKETKCPFTKTDIEDAYGPEVSLFLHCHLRGYDRHGEGKYPDQGNRDKNERAVTTVDILYEQNDIRIYSHGLRRLVDDKSVASCQKTCCKLIVKTCTYSPAATCFNKL